MPEILLNNIFRGVFCCYLMVCIPLEAICQAAKKSNSLVDPRETRVDTYERTFKSVIQNEQRQRTLEVLENMNELALIDYNSVAVRKIKAFQKYSKIINDKSIERKYRYEALQMAKSLFIDRKRTLEFQNENLILIDSHLDSLLDLKLENTLAVSNLFKAEDNFKKGSITNITLFRNIYRDRTSKHEDTNISEDITKFNAYLLLTKGLTRQYLEVKLGNIIHIDVQKVKNPSK